MGGRKLREGQAESIQNLQFVNNNLDNNLRSITGKYQEAVAEILDLKLMNDSMTKEVTVAPEPNAKLQSGLDDNAKKAMQSYSQCYSAW